MTVKVVAAARLTDLFGAIQQRGFTVIGPTLRDDVVTYGPLTSLEDLPRGRGDEQGPARYRTTARDDGALFGYAAPVQSAKAVFFPAEELLWRSRMVRQGESPPTPAVEPADTAGKPPVALFGIRSCDLAALAQHDHILTQRLATDVHYAARRKDTLVVAVACSDPAATCFCASVDTGPAPREGYDIALTEVIDEIGHRFVATPGTGRGIELLEEIGADDASAADIEAAEGVVTRATGRMGRELDTDDLVGVLYAAVEAKRWDDVAARCLSCGNCTLVCPTCFCTTITDVSDLTGDNAERHRVWASCFTADYSYIHGGSVRVSTRSRYRQWLTHKLAAWQTQFGTVGCVGCGRCITWCPAGIDLTEEVAAIRAADAPVARPATAASVARPDGQPRRPAAAPPPSPSATNKEATR